MVGVAAGLAFAPSLSRLAYRPAAALHASVPSSSARSLVALWGRDRGRGRLVVVARYSSSYGNDEDDEDEFGGGGRRDRGPEQEQDPALDIERIESSTVRLLDAEKRMVGVLSVSEAVKIADDSDLILAILSLDGDPPVLRLFEEKEYKKHKYEQQKKKRVQQKRSVAKRMGLKELKMGYNIDIHDYSVRLKAARKFLKAGDKVKIVVNLKGRENLYKKQAIELLRRFQNDVGELGIEGSKNFAERNIFLILVPNKLAIQKEQDDLNKKDTAEEDTEESEDDLAGDELVIEKLEESEGPETLEESKEPETMEESKGPETLEESKEPETMEESKEPETEVSANV